MESEEVLAALEKRHREGYTLYATGVAPELKGQRIKAALVAFHPDRRVHLTVEFENMKTGAVKTRARELTLGAYMTYHEKRRMALGTTREIAHFLQEQR
ncbi:MAG: hypothetical protein V1722_05605 [Candidatus Micrarchaeota archaeon]